MVSILSDLICQHLKWHVKKSYKFEGYGCGLCQLVDSNEGVLACFSNSCCELWAAAQSSLGSGLDHTDVVRWFEELAHARLGE
jgi:hypothetical protein